MRVDVAALNLVGVGDVVWDLEVINGAEPANIVWRQRITSSRFGDGEGSASYVGPCDASPGVAENDVRLWVVGVYGEAIDVPGAFGDAPPGGALAFENPTPYDTTTATWAAPMSQSVVCAENADRPVRFDVALMRPAQQGFFDIAVNFNDIFCSAKFDCCIASEQGCPDIMLLHDAEGKRSTTFVLGFACTAGTGAGVDTRLYLDDIELDCTSSAPDSFTADLVIDPSGTPGNQCEAGQLGGQDGCGAVTAAGAVDADDYLYQVGLYRGLEQLTSEGAPAQKVYWNVALGVMREESDHESVGIEDCRLRTRGTANDAEGPAIVEAGVIAAGTVYPFIQWDVDLRACQAEALTFGDADAMVRTAYTTTGANEGTSFNYGYGPSLPAGRVAAVSGLCGPAHGGSVLVAPTDDRCAIGTPSEVDGDGPYSWTCAGEHGGPTASCGANRSCAPGFIAWTVEDITCEGILGQRVHDGSMNVTNSTKAGRVGSRDYTCSQGTWVATGPGTCEYLTPAGMSYIPPGTFLMGSPPGEVGELPNETQHSVTLSRGFYMQTTEVTQGDWEALTGVNPSIDSDCGDDCPVENVDWYSALAYANALSDSQDLTPCYTLEGCTESSEGWKDGQHVGCTGATFVGLSCSGYRLPTEAEWEYAARAGTLTATYAGDFETNYCTDPTLVPIAWFCGNADGAIQRVARKEENDWGLHDMLGNVWEWTWNWYDWTEPPDAVTDPLGPDEPLDPQNPRRVRRGGSWYEGPTYNRAASRAANSPSTRGTTIGFRLCRSVP